MPSQPDSPETIASAIEIRDPDIDQARVRERVAAALAARRAWAGRNGIDYDGIVAAQPVSDASEARAAAIRGAIERLRAAPAQATVQAFLTPSPVPVLGGIVQRVRMALHRVAIFYVNQSAGKQATFNQAAAASIYAMEGASADAARVVELLERVAILEREVAKLRHDASRRARE
jgi:uncharacterized small protein (DUF1192 family)